MAFVFQTRHNRGAQEAWHVTPLPLPCLLATPPVPTPLTHIIAETTAATRGPWVPRLGGKPSPAEGWDCLLLSGLPVELLT